MFARKFGNDSLKALQAVIHTNNDFMTIQHKVPLKEQTSHGVNHLNLRTSTMTENQNKRFKIPLGKFLNLFSEPNKSLTYTTTVKGEIRTAMNDPVYAKSYPYFLALKGGEK